MRTYFCCDEQRRNAVRGRANLNGIDFVEVSEDQRTLVVHVLNPLTAGALGIGNVVIEGGERIRAIEVTAVSGGAGPASPPASPPLSPPSSPPTSPPASPPSPPLAGSPRVVTVEVAAPGDFSPYRLRLVRAPDDPRPPEGFDPRLSAIEFSFKAGCPSDLDCAPDPGCPPAADEEPELDYLARDYASFRRLMLDRLSVLAPEWRDRNAADLGVTLVELLAFVGDYLSYEQDAVATEAYLGTARKRVSLRRHARLVDYRMHDGANARAWIQVRVRPGVAGVVLRREEAGTVARVLTRVPALTGVDGEAVAVVAPDTDAYGQAMDQDPVVFELRDRERVLDARHNEMRFHDWGDRDCCLPRGATRATLRGDVSDLAPGEVLVLAEARGPETGARSDADPTRRHAVRLTEVRRSRDPLLPGSPPEGPGGGSGGGAVTEIAWHPDDALPFPLCLSSRVGDAYFDDVSVALGNIVLADHGQTSDPEPLAPVPRPAPALARVAGARGHCDEADDAPWLPPYRPSLAGSPVTQAVRYDPDHPPASARATIDVRARDALPAVRLREGDRSWTPRRDLLASGPADRHFVVEVEEDDRARLRFGDDRYGSRPAAGVALTAVYRIGNGARGNVGAGTLRHLVGVGPAFDAEVVERVWNPLPARGGTEKEGMEEVRQKAPYAFRTQDRAVTEADYAEQAARVVPDIQHARARFRWTGSWRTAFLTVDRLAGREVDAAFERELRARLERFRMAGHDLEVDGPRDVPLVLEMTACVALGYRAADVKAALLERFGNRTLPGGGTGLFHPDRFTFGQSVHLGPLYAAAQAIEGVASVEITAFHRQARPDTEAFTTGRLDMGRLEIPRLDNDPDFPGRGVLKLTLEGGL